MRESVIYQEILQEGRQEGLQTGRREEAQRLTRRLIERRFGAIAPERSQQIWQLDTAALEALSEALLEFRDLADLSTWLQNQAN